MSILLKGVGSIKPNVGYFLQTYPNASAAYSTRRLSSSYSGSAMRVRRSSDSTELDIGFIGEDLDTPALITFAGAGSAFVKTWYDQSGNGRDVTNLTTSEQPTIVSSGSLVVVNGKPSVLFAATQHLKADISTTSSWKFMSDGTHHSIYSAARCGVVANPNTTYALFGTNTVGTSAVVGAFVDYLDSAGSNDAIRSVVANGGGGFPVINTSANGVMTANTLKLLSIINKPAHATPAERSEIRVNASAAIKNNAQSVAVSVADPNKPLQIGGYGNLAAFVGSISELILYPTDQTANNTDIQTNINAFFLTF